MPDRVPPSSDTGRSGKIGWRPYVLLLLLVVACLGSTLLAASIPPPSGTAWFPISILAVGEIAIIGFAIVLGVKRMHLQLETHINTASALRQADTFRQALEASSTGGLRARTNEGRITYVSPAFCRMTGFSSEELIGACFPSIPYWDPKRSESNLEKFNRAMNGEIPSNGLEVSMQRKNGETFDALVIESPFIDAAGQHIGWLGAVIDITEQKRLREQNQRQYERLQATSRLVTMGEMASTMAHELNQPLAAISSYVTGCLNQLNSNQLDVPELKDVQYKIARQAQRAAGIIGRVHSFVRRAEPHFGPNDLNSIVREAIALIEISAIKHEARIICELQRNLPLVSVDTQMIEQVIINLLRNAIDAMSDIAPEKRTIHVSTYLATGGISLAVADQGCGISSEIAAHLFEPFFTTKRQGMGMGLNICRTILELHHGLLAFEPNPSGGTIFTLTLRAIPLHAE
ncbi:MAG: PAS domain S-box protein [Betaproteobacteria bacterium]|nr:PAS domain S-box protein [Betaproteobacteria bacterium]MCL2162706.1 PAS domain S-box protein [Betaproteobacteria bacterium]